MVLMGSKFPFTHCNRPAYYEYIIASMYSMLSLYLGILFSFHKSSTVQQNTLTVGFQSIEIAKKVFLTFDNIFHAYLMSRLKKNAKKIFFHGGLFFKSTLSVLRCTWTGRII